LSTRRAGDGPLLLCLHGIGGSSATFEPQLASLADLATVVAWDAPGYAGSPDSGAHLTMDDYADVAAEVIEAHGQGRAAVLGMSWGGVIAMRLAQRHPERVRALVLGDSTRGSGRSPETAAAMRSRAAELAEVGPDVFAQRRAARLLRTSAPADEVASQARAMASAIRLPGYGDATASMAATWLDGSLGTIDVPTLVLHGDDDRITGAPESEAIAAQIPGAVLRVVPEAGHLANTENPMAFDAHVRSFLRALAPARR
ncbi:UNVERIFIED_CONTAM: hydrolase, partial [Mumia flava]